MKSGDYIKLKEPKLPKIHGQGVSRVLIINDNGRKVELVFGQVYKTSARVSDIIKGDTKPYPKINLDFAKKHKEKFETINQGE